MRKYSLFLVALMLGMQFVPVKANDFGNSTELGRDLGYSFIQHNGPEIIANIARGGRRVFRIRINNSLNGTSALLRKGRYQVILYSGGRPNPGVRMSQFESEYGGVIDDVDIVMELRSASGRVIARSKRYDAGATPGYYQILEAKNLPVGEYLVVCTNVSATDGNFSVHWFTDPVGD